jgi:predicted kinase
MEQKKRLWIMVGIPASGKSTFIATHDNFFNEQKAVVSRDAVRFSMIKEEDEYFSREKEVFNEFIRQIKVSLEENFDTIVDATHINVGSRSKLLRALGDSLKNIEINAIVIRTPLDIALVRNSKREGLSLVPESAIRDMYFHFTIPTIDEGFDNIWIVKEENGKKIYQIINAEVA